MTDPTKTAQNASARTIVEEWTEVVLLMGALIDRVDRLVVRAGCTSRVEFMKRLAREWKQHGALAGEVKT